MSLTRSKSRELKIVKCRKSIIATLKKLGGKTARHNLRWECDGVVRPDIFNEAMRRLQEDYQIKADRSGNIILR